MKQYIGISRDHSLSMSGLRDAAMKDFNETLQAIQNAAGNSNVDTVMSVVECGRDPYNVSTNFRRPYDPWATTGRVHGIVHRDVTNTPAQLMKPLTVYPTDGGSTPLLDSVGELIAILESAPDARQPDVSFIVMVITDGEENSSKAWLPDQLASKIRRLTATDRWTFVFRCPRGYSRNLTKLGVPEGNILEWDQTQKGVEIATTATNQAFDNYYTIRSSGVTSTDKFFVNLNHVPATQIKAALIDVTSKVNTWDVWPKDNGLTIRDYWEKSSSVSYVPGHCYYQLTKTETVQPNKLLIIEDINTGAYYTGRNSRDLLGLPHTGNITLSPTKFDKYKVYVQSTSYTRKVVGSTKILYFK